MRCCWGCSTSYLSDLKALSRSRCFTPRASLLHSSASHTHRHFVAASAGTLRRTFATGNRLQNLTAQGRNHLRRQQLHVSCGKDDSKSSNSRRPRRRWPPWNWLQSYPSLPRLIFNITAFFLLVRIWPLHGRSSLGQAQPVAVPVPFSEFIQRTDAKQVSAVVIDNRNVKYQLQPNAPLFKDLPDNVEPKNVAFETTRPVDYAMPYDKLVKQGVRFAAVDGRNNTAMTVLVCHKLIPRLCHSV